jgi:hypothetical protein
MASAEPDGDVEHLVDAVPAGALVIASIEIVRYIDTEDRDVVIWCGVDAADEPLSLVEALGMLELTKDTAIREALGGEAS